MTIFPRGSLGDPHEGILVPRVLWTPADISEAIFTMPSHDLSLMWTDDLKTTHPTAAGDEIFHIDDPISGLDIDGLGANTRPFLRSDATRNSSLHFVTSIDHRRFSVENSAATFNNFHVNGTGSLFLWAKFGSASSGVIEVLVDNSQTTANNKGFYLYRSDTNQMVFGIGNGTGTTVMTIGGFGIVDTNWHRVKIRVAAGANASSMQIDGGSLSKGTVGTLTTGNAVGNMWIGARNGGGFQSQSQISNLLICSSVPSAEDIALWEAYNPPIG